MHGTAHVHNNNNETPPSHLPALKQKRREVLPRDLQRPLARRPGAVVRQREQERYDGRRGQLSWDTNHGRKRQTGVGGQAGTGVRREEEGRRASATVRRAAEVDAGRLGLERERKQEREKDWKTLTF